jgi:hypothetical protein
MVRLPLNVYQLLSLDILRNDDGELFNKIYMYSANLSRAGVRRLWLKLQSISLVCTNYSASGGLAVSVIEIVHGHLWHCFNCDTKWNKGNNSFDYDKAMWNHLKDCHDAFLDSIQQVLVHYKRKLNIQFAISASALNEKKKEERILAA